MSAIDGKQMKSVAQSVDSRGDRLESWKEIASYLGRGVRTTQRWEKREGLPVHRHVHAKASSVWAFRHEIDAWRHSRTLAASEPAPKEENQERAAESLNPTLLAAARMPVKWQSWAKRCCQSRVARPIAGRKSNPAVLLRTVASGTGCQRVTQEFGNSRQERELHPVRWSVPHSLLHFFALSRSRPRPKRVLPQPTICSSGAKWLFRFFMSLASPPRQSGARPYCLFRLWASLVSKRYHYGHGCRFKV